VKAIEPVLDESGSYDNPNNHPFAKFRKWASLTHAAKIQQKDALQEQVRAVGMEIAALEKMIKEEDTEK
jgi:hypothetical protein